MPASPKKPAAKKPAATKKPTAAKKPSVAEMMTIDSDSDAEPAPKKKAPAVRAKVGDVSRKSAAFSDITWNFELYFVFQRTRDHPVTQLQRLELIFFLFGR